MLSPTPREGAGSRCHAGARALAVSLALAALLATADLSPNPSSVKGGAASPASASPAAPRPAAAPADPDAALQRLAAETERIQPSSPDAVARLKTVIRDLIVIERAQNREIAALLAGSSPRDRVAVSRRRSKTSAPPPAAAVPGTLPSPPADGAPALVQAPPAASALFGKRGLKKVHRPGCVFGERIKAADRVYFNSMKEAAAAGYEPCKICRPDR